ncbi:Uncharacterised protein [Shigella sonnei]|nr:Uncharacterised protein [Shigella sonnei]CSR95592.1 Uncharacterised protein [Shigella sonnei]
MLTQILLKIMTQPVLLIDGELAFINQEDLVTRHLQQQLVVEAVEFLIGFQHPGLNFAQ